MSMRDDEFLLYLNNRVNSASASEMIVGGYILVKLSRLTGMKFDQQAKALYEITKAHMQSQLSKTHLKELLSRKDLVNPEKGVNWRLVIIPFLFTLLFFVLMILGSINN